MDDTIQALKNGVLSVFDTQLAALYAGQTGDATAIAVLGLNSDGSAPVSPNGSPDFVTVDVTSKDGDGAALLAELNAIGLQSGSSFHNIASGILPVSQLGALMNVPDLSFAQESGATFSVGNVTSQSNQALLADVARATNSVDGTGIKVGVLSDSFNNLGGMNGDISTGDLPSNTTVMSDLSSGGTDEGRAMAQIVHDIAPGASIEFATAFNGLASFANNIVALAQAGAKVIVDDVSYFAETAFQDGPIAQAIDEATAMGAVYFSAAGNDANKGFEASFVSSGVVGPYSEDMAKLTTGNNPQYLPVTIPRGATVYFVLEWNQPAQSVSGTVASQSDVDLFLYNSGGTVVGQSIADNLGHDPVEVISYTNKGATATFNLGVGLFAGPAPTDFKLMALDNGAGVTLGTSSLNTDSGTVYGHSAASTAISVAAASYQSTPQYGTNPPIVESYSSDGPTRIEFDTAGNALTTPIVRQTPDITATDGADTTFFGSDSDGDGWPNFFGTSAAAPAAAAVAALMLQANGLLIWSDILNLLDDSAIDMNNPVTSGFDTGYDNATGAGLIQANEAVDFAKTLIVTGNSSANTILGTHLDDNLDGAAGNDIINGFGGQDTLYGSGGADKFVFDGTALASVQASPTSIDNLVDYDQGNTGLYSGAEGDLIDVSATTGTAFAAGQAAGTLARVVEDPSGAHVLLQVDPDGAANGTSWTTLSTLDGIHTSDIVNAVLGSGQPSGAPLTVLSDSGLFGDFDGDGKADLLWRDDNGMVATWQISGGTVSASHFLFGASSDWHILGIGDFNGDGKSDVLWGNDDGALLDWQMASSAQVATTVSMGDAPANSYLAGIGDVDHDGKSDLIWRDSTTGAVTIDTAAGATGTIGGMNDSWSVVGVGDFNGDGMADILFRNAATGASEAWLMNGVGVASTVTYPVVDATWHIVGAGDFNGDGTTDLFWHNDNGTNAVWLMDTTGHAEEIDFTVGTSNDWHVVGTGDINGDHRDDVIWRSDSGATAIWQMNGSAAPTVAFPGGAPAEWDAQTHNYDFV